MLEKSKWQRELVVFSRLVNTLVMTGNVSDQCPVIDEANQRIRGACSLEVYLASACQELGYQAVLFYTPIDGFYLPKGFKQKTDVLKLVENTVSAQESCQNGQGNQQGNRQANQEDPEEDQ